MSDTENPVPTPETPIDETPTDEKPKDDRVLLFTPNFKHWYALPRGHELPSGDTDVVRLVGGLKKVDPEALAAFEITSEEARTLFRGRVEGAFGEAARAVEHGGEVIREAATKVPLPDKEKVADGVAEVLGVTREDLKDPDKVFGHLKDRAVGFGRKVKETVEPTPERRDAARKKVDSIVDSVRKEGAEVAEGLGKVPGAVQDFFEKAEVEEKVKSAADRLRAVLHRKKEAGPAEEKPVDDKPVDAQEVKPE